MFFGMLLSRQCCMACMSEVDRLPAILLWLVQCGSRLVWITAHVGQLARHIGALGLCA